MTPIHAIARSFPTVAVIAGAAGVVAGRALVPPAPAVPAPAAVEQGEPIPDPPVPLVSLTPIGPWDRGWYVAEGSADVVYVVPRTATVDLTRDGRADVFDVLAFMVAIAEENR